MNKQFLIIIVAIVLGLFGILSLTKKDDNSANKGSGSTTTAASEHVVGKADSNVTLVEYGDFQCPACKSYYPIVNQIKTEYGDRIKFQFRHFPLVQIHPNAYIGSRAAEAAGKQGKFYEMHDLLYQNQETWSTAKTPATTLESYATQLQLNLDQFKSDMNGVGVADTINADVKAGQAAGANSTPTFVLNGKKIDKNPQSYEDFKKLIDEALGQKS